MDSAKFSGSVVRTLGVALVACGAMGILASGAVFAQSVDQTLDKIDVSAPKEVLGVKQTPELRTIPYELGATAVTAFKNCQGTGTRGLYCLDGNTVARFPNPDETDLPVSREDLVICDSQVGLANCTAMAVDLAGNITLAGQTSGTTATPTYSIVRLRKASGPAASPICPSSEFLPAPLVSEDYQRYCYATLVGGRQLISDLQAIDGAAGANFTFNAGFLTLEGPAPGQPYYYRALTGTTAIELGRWANVLGNTETLTGVTLLQFRSAVPAKNFIVGTTNTGRVLSGLIPASGATNFRASATNLTLSTSNGNCAVAPTAPAPYRLRASVRTRTTYFTRGCTVVGYQPTLTSNGSSFTFAAMPALTQNTTFVQNGVSVSPGIEIDFVKDNCTQGIVNGTVFPAGCDLLQNGDSNPFVAARLSGVALVGSATDWTVFQVKNLPDCRYLVPRTGLCAAASAVIDQDGIDVPANFAGDTSGNPKYDPTKQYLNITPLLPPEVTQATVLPDRMLLGPKFRARQTLSGRTEPYRFDALFGVGEDGLQYKDTFQFTADIADLLGIPQPDLPRCGGFQIINPTNPALWAAPPWDVIANVSEQVPTVGGPGMRSYVNGQPPATEWVGWLQNGDYCENPSGSISVRGSAFMYGLELAPREQRTVGGTKYWFWPDSTYALLMRSLAKDLNDHIYTYTCQALDGQVVVPPGTLPVAPVSDCTQLLKDWVVTYPKLTSCINATDKPKSSAGNEACNAFETQFAPFKRLVDALLASPANDPNNRVGELKARVGILSATYFKQFKPSIKDRGFTDPNM